MTDDESPSETDDRRDAPLTDLAEEVGRRREERTADAVEEAFTEMDVEGDVDAEDVWDRLDRNETTTEVEDAAADPALDAEADDDPVAAPVGESVDVDGDERVIPSRICHGCRYFGSPPEMACTHEGTEIREMVDVDHYRVVDCPVIVDEGEFELEGVE